MDGFPALIFIYKTGNTDCVPVEVLIFYTMNLEHPHQCSACDAA
jgi:hypothetical protein